MNRVVKRDNKRKKIEKIPQALQKFLVVFTSLILLWVVLLYLNNGINIASVGLFATLFLIVVIVSALLYHKNYLKVRGLLKKKFPSLNRAKVLKIAFITSIVLGIIARLSFLLIANKYNPESDLSDTGFHWYFAQKLANNIEPGVYDGGYGAFFPHLMTYSATLAGFMKLFGTSYIAIITSNLIFDLCTAAIIYILLKKWRGNQAGQIGVILWMLNPLEIIFCAVGVAIVVTNTMLALSLLLAYFLFCAIRNQSWTKTTLLSLSLGIVLSIGNAYRPIFTVLLIALTIVLICLVMRYGRKKIIFVGLSFVLVSGSLIGVNKVIDLGYSSINSYHVSGGTGVGWNFFIGANYDSWGRWNRDDSVVFSDNVYQYQDEETPQVNQDLVSVQSDFFSEGIRRYQAMSLGKLLSHFFHKTTALFVDPDNTVSWVFYEAFRIDANHPVYLFMENIGVIYMASCVVISLCYFIKLIRSRVRKWCPYLVFLTLGFCGVIAASLLVEVMHRYVMSLLVFLVIFAACYFSEEKSNICNGAKKS